MVTIPQCSERDFAAVCYYSVPSGHIRGEFLGKRPAGSVHDYLLCAGGKGASVGAGSPGSTRQQWASPRSRKSVDRDVTDIVESQSG